MKNIKIRVTKDKEDEVEKPKIQFSKFALEEYPNDQLRRAVGLREQLTATPPQQTQENLSFLVMRLGDNPGLRFGEWAVYRPWHASCYYNIEICTLKHNRTQELQHFTRPAGLELRSSEQVVTSGSAFATGSLLGGILPFTNNSGET